MARDCPACERPNADTASKCLYCSAPLPPVAKPARVAGSDVAAAEAEAEPPRPERFLVVLFPARDPESLVEDFSRVTGLGLYESKQHMLSRRPRLFRRLEQEVEARTLSTNLTRAGVPHYVVEEASMLALPISRARRIAAHDRHLEVSLDHTTMTVSNGDLLLVVYGEITRERHREERLGSDRGVSHRLTSEQRLHLYAQEATVAIEIEPDTFDWSVLSDQRTSSSLLNVKRFLESLAATTSATHDRGFAGEPAVLSRSSLEEDPSGALTQAERGPDGMVWDNEEQFRYYARWRYRLERYLQRHGKAM